MVAQSSGRLSTTINLYFLYLPMSIVLNNFHKKLFDCNNEIKKKSQRYRD